MQITMLLSVWTIVSWIFLLVLFIIIGELWRQHRRVRSAVQDLLALGGRASGRKLQSSFTFTDWHRLASEALIRGVLLDDGIPYLDNAADHGRRAFEASHTDRQKILASGLLKTIDEIRMSLRASEQRQAIEDVPNGPA